MKRDEMTGWPLKNQEALRALYEETDRLLAGWTCSASSECCRFGLTGREPLLWPNEWLLVDRALAARGLGGKRRRRARLPVFGRGAADPERPCPLLSDEGRCTVYEVRPFGCRTFFCERAEGPARRPPREALARIGREIAALARRDDPRTDGPLPLTRWLDRRGR